MTTTTMMMMVNSNANSGRSRGIVRSIAPQPPPPPPTTTTTSTTTTLTTQQQQQGSSSSSLLQLNNQNLNVNTTANTTQHQKQQHYNSQHININHLSSTSTTPPVGAVANPVVIIHQNQSISTNLQQQAQVNVATVSSGAQKANGHTSLNSCCNSSANNSAQQHTGSQNGVSQVDEMMSELKYMKGYVNVLKERFTRKSLDADHHQQALQTSASTGNTISSSRYVNDYSRRRSVSPFIQYGTACTHQSAKSKFTNPQVGGQQSSKQLKERKLFASSDDLRSHHTYNYRHHNYVGHHYYHHEAASRSSRSGAELTGTSATTTTGTSAVPGIQGDQVVKCTYSNEINKDELPRPNFVSSVKNLFEKQLTAACAGSIVKSSSGASSSSSSSSAPAPLAATTNTNTLTHPSAVTQHHNSRFYHSSNSSLAHVNGSGPSSVNGSAGSGHQLDLIDSVTRLKNNCTVVYEHTEGVPPSPLHAHVSNSSSSVASSAVTLSHLNQNGSETSSTQFIHMNGSIHHSVNKTMNGHHHMDELSKETSSTTSVSNRTAKKTQDNARHQNNHLSRLSGAQISRKAAGTVASATTAPVSCVNTNVEMLRQNGGTYDASTRTNGGSESPPNVDKENKEVTLVFDTLSVPTEPVTANRVLSIKERKEMFSKKQLQNSQLPNQLTQSSPVKQLAELQSLQQQSIQSPTANPTVKRIRIEDSSITQSDAASHHNQVNSAAQNADEKPVSNGLKPKVVKKTFTNGSSTKPIAPIATNSYVAQSINSIYNNNSVTISGVPNESSSNGTLDNNNNKTIMEKESASESADETGYVNHRNVTAPLVSDSAAEMSADRIFEQQSQQAKLKAKSAVKMKTFFGGEEIKCLDQIQPHVQQHIQIAAAIQPPSLPPPPLPKSATSSMASVQQANHSHAQMNATSTNNTNSSTSSLDYFNFEFVGAGIKLEKSILIVNSQSSNPNITFGDDIRGSRNKNGASLRVNFTDVAETYEYPSYEFLLKEMGIMDGDEEESAGGNGIVSGASRTSININGDGDEYPYESSSDSVASQNGSTNGVGNQLGTTSTTSFTQFLPGRMASRTDGDERDDDEHDDDDNDDDDDDDDDDDYPDSSNYNQIETGGTYLNGTNRNGYHRRRGEDGDQEDTTGFYENFASDTNSNKIDNKFSKLGTFTNFKPSWHNINYELGVLNENGPTVNGSASHVRLKPVANPAVNGELNAADASVITRDILPSKDDEVKRWSCEMDSNILF